MKRVETDYIKNRIKGYLENKTIVEKKLHIPANYQAVAIKSKNYLQANWHQNKITILRQVFFTSKESVLLDLGTGSGNLEFFFHNKFKKIIGVDYNDEALLYLQGELLKRNISNVELIQADIRNLSKTKLPKVDFITMIDVIEHLKLQDVEILVKNFTRLLEKGGKIIIVTPNYKSLWPLIEWLLERFRLVPKFTNAQHLSKMDRGVLTRVFGKNNFNLESLSTFNNISFLVPSKKISYLLCKLENFLQFPYGNLIVAVFTH